MFDISEEHRAEIEECADLIHTFSYAYNYNRNSKFYRDVYHKIGRLHSEFAECFDFEDAPFAYMGKRADEYAADETHIAFVLYHTDNVESVPFKDKYNLPSKLTDIDERIDYSGLVYPFGRFRMAYLKFGNVVTDKIFKAFKDLFPLNLEEQELFIREADPFLGGWTDRLGYRLSAHRSRVVLIDHGADNRGLYFHFVSNAPLDIAIPK